MIPAAKNSTGLLPEYVNGQEKANNKIIVYSLKKRLKERRRRWAEDLLLALSVDRNTTKNSTGQASYSLVFRTEVAIPL